MHMRGTTIEMEGEICDKNLAKKTKCMITNANKLRGSCEDM